MTKLVRKLLKCIHRSHINKKVKFEMNLISNEYFKLSRFELLPDEILIQIFEYIPLKDLYNTFVNLNFRLNLLLRDIRIGIYLYQNEQINENLFRSLCYFSKQIQYIHIDHNPLINLQIFSNLKSLIIYLPTKRQLLQINNQNLPNLNRLSIGIIHQHDQKILLKNLFGEKKLLKLNYCYLYQIDFNESFSSYQYSYNIRHLFIKNIQIKDFSLILSLLPNLYQLDISISDMFLKSFENLTKFSHENLRILKIEFLEKFSPLKFLNILMSFVPFIEQLTLLLIQLIKLKDYLILEKILSNNFSQLKQFICSIDYYCSLSSNQMIDKFNRLKIQNHFYQTIQILPCLTHQDHCLRKIFISKILTPIH